MTRLLEGLTFTETEPGPSGVDKDEVIKQQRLENEQLRQENEALKRKIAELEAKLVAGT